MNKKTRILSSVMAMTCAFGACMSLGACGTTQKVDVTGTIIIEPFANSSFGINWIETMAKNWQEETGSQYKVLVKKNSTNLSGTQMEGIEVSNTDIFFGSDAMYNTGFYKGYFEDLSDMLEVKPDGESGKTIREKIYNWDKWRKVSSIVKYNKPAGEVEDPYASEYFTYEGTYMLPYSTTITGFMYDHDLFLDNGLMAYAEVSNEVKSALTAQGITYEEKEDDFGDTMLYFVSATGDVNLEAGDPILTAGKDGKYGTYDDGQPQTMEELHTLFSMIMAKGQKPLLYCDTAEYVTNLFLSYLFQKNGVDTYNAYVSFDTDGKEVKLMDGTSTAINFTNGYLTYSIEGVEEAAEFVKKYFIDGSSSTRYFNTTTTVGDVRDEFVTNTSKKKLQMIVEGDWFVKGATDILYENNRDPKTVDYRFMLLPAIEGQAGIDGEGNGSVLTAPETGGIVVRKQPESNPNKLAAIKSFLTYMLKNDTLSWINATTGMTLNYHYDITKEDAKVMTRFSKTCSEIFHDTENIATYPYSVDKLSTPIRYTANGMGGYTIMYYGNNDAVSLITALKGGNKPSKIAELVASTATKTVWDGYLKDMEAMLGVK